MRRIETSADEVYFGLDKFLGDATLFEMVSQNRRALHVNARLYRFLVIATGVLFVAS